MVFIFRIPIVDGRFQRHVFYSAFRDFSVCRCPYDISSTIFGRDSCGNGRIYRDGMAVDLRDSTFPSNVYISRFPSRIIKSTAEIFHLETFYPFFSARSDDVDSISFVERIDRGIVGNIYRQRGATRHDFIV